MRFLTTYLWKEWRDHRATVLGFLAIVPVVLGGLMLSIRGSWSSSAELPTLVALCGFAIAALTIAADVVPGEFRRGQIAFLRRMPGDLGIAFLSKFLMVAALAFGFAGWGYLCTTTWSAMACGGSWFPRFMPGVIGPGSLLLAVVAAWVFAASGWLPRGTLALPAALLVIALFGAPLVLAVLLHPGFDFRGGEYEALTAWLVVAACLVAALSFIRGYRHGGGPVRAAVLGLGATFVAFLPPWGYAASRVSEWCRLDPTDASFHIGRAGAIESAVLIGSGGRYAFVNGRHELAWDPEARWTQEWGAWHPLIVDLTTGEWRAATEPGSVFFTVGSLIDPVPTPLAFVTSLDSGPLRRGTPRDFDLALDGATGAELGSARAKELMGRFGAFDGAIAHAGAALVLPDGRRIWSRGWWLDVEERDGSVHELVGTRRSTHGPWWRAIGRGFVSSTRSVYDPARGRVFDVAGNAWSFVEQVRRGRWLVVTSLEPHRRNVPDRRHYGLYDPETAETGPVAGLAPEDTVLDLAHDDRLLVVAHAAVAVGDGGLESRLFLLDPETGVKSVVDGSPFPSSLSVWISTKLRTAAGRFVLASAQDAPASRRCWQFDPATASLRATAELPADADVVACPDEESVLLLIAHHTLARARFDGSPEETLFPR